MNPTFTNSTTLMIAIELAITININNFEASTRADRSNSSFTTASMNITNTTTPSEPTKKQMVDDEIENRGVKAVADLKSKTPLVAPSKTIPIASIETTKPEVARTVPRKPLPLLARPIWRKSAVNATSSAPTTTTTTTTLEPKPNPNPEPKSNPEQEQKSNPVPPVSPSAPAIGQNASILSIDKPEPPIVKSNPQPKPKPRLPSLTLRKMPPLKPATPPLVRRAAGSGNWEVLCAPFGADGNLRYGPVSGRRAWHMIWNVPRLDETDWDHRSAIVDAAHLFAGFFNKCDADVRPGDVGVIRISASKNDNSVLTPFAFWAVFVVEQGRTRLLSHTPPVTDMYSIHENIKHTPPVPYVRVRVQAFPAQIRAQANGKHLIFNSQAFRPIFRKRGMQKWKESTIALFCAELDWALGDAHPADEDETTSSVDENSFADESTSDLSDFESSGDAGGHSDSEDGLGPDGAGDYDSAQYADWECD